MEPFTIPSNLSLTETYANKRGRLDENQNDEDFIRKRETKQKAEAAKRMNKPKGKKKPPPIPPVVNMVDPYTPQQFFDQPAHISIGQLLAGNQKLTMNIMRQLRKPIARKVN